MSIINKLKNSSFFKDSFWAVFGNGMGYALLLLAGIIVARFLGKDLYGEYGFVKTSLFYIASFATFGIGYSSTKYIAQYIQTNQKVLYILTKRLLVVSFVFSVVTCLILFLFAGKLAEFAGDERLIVPFRYLGVIVVLRAMSVTEAGIISGYKEYKKLAFNNIVSGLVMLLLCIPLTYYWGLKGSLFTLLLSQLTIALMNLHCVLRINSNNVKELVNIKAISYISILKFSFPIALHEMSYTFFNLLGTMMFSRFSSLGEFGLFTAVFQWNTVILFVPGLLSNVILSYLSGDAHNKNHHQMLSKMLVVNFICSFIPFLVVLALSDFIVSLYGPSFIGMKSVLNIFIFSTIIMSLIQVYQANLLSEGYTWMYFLNKLFRDASLVGVFYLVLIRTNGEHAAYNYGIINLIVLFVNLIFLFICNKFNKNQSIQA